MPASVQDALSSLLFALGFHAMAEQVKSERDAEKLRLYARIVAKEAPASVRAEISDRLRRLGLL